MAAFPNGTLSSCKQSFVSNVERSEMESGLVKQAVKFDKQRIHYVCRYTFTPAEYAAFLTFYRTTVRGGADVFDWTDPFEETAHTNAVIVGGDVEAEPFNGVMAAVVVSLTIEVYV